MTIMTLWQPLPPMLKTMWWSWWPLVKVLWWPLWQLVATLWQPILMAQVTLVTTQMTLDDSITSYCPRQKKVIGLLYILITFSRIMRSNFWFLFIPWLMTYNMDDHSDDMDDQRPQVTTWWRCCDDPNDCWWRSCDDSSDDTRLFCDDPTDDTWLPCDDLCNELATILQIKWWHLMTSHDPHWQFYRWSQKLPVFQVKTFTLFKVTVCPVLGTTKWFFIRLWAQKNVYPACYSTNFVSILRFYEMYLLTFGWTPYKQFFWYSTYC
jgi:hypothetical protein